MGSVGVAAAGQDFADFSLHQQGDQGVVDAEVTGEHRARDRGLDELRDGDPIVRFRQQINENSKFLFFRLVQKRFIVHGS